jgi:Bacterial transcriptional repressor
VTLPDAVLYQLVQPASQAVFLSLCWSVALKWRCTFMRLFRLLQRDGHMDRALGDDDLAGIAINAYIIWFSWLGYVRTVAPDAPLDRATGARGALQSFHVLAPHLEGAFAARARGILEQGAGMRRRASRRAVRGG